ncbi:hypothetical protein B566_EDAN016064 [Ephemera danica]|nr:hypothetical protein B566_EDAN016064 [Ephemera danica]
MSQSPRWILPFPESCPLDEDDMTVWYGKEEQVEVGPPASPVDEPDSTVEEKKTEGEQPSGAEEKENEMEQEVAVVKKEDELSDEGTEKVNEKVVEVEQPAIVEKSEADKPQKDDDEDEETIPLITADDDDDDDENKENLPPYSRMVESVSMTPSANNPQSPVVLLCYPSTPRPKRTLVSLNSKMLSSPCNLFAFRKYLETLYNYNLEAKGSHQTMSLFYKDTPGKMDDLADNVGLTARKAHIKEGKTVSMMGRLDVDILGQNKYLLNGVSMGITLIRSKPSFCLMSSGASPFFVKITDATLLIKRMKLSQSILLSLEKVLMTSTAKYATTRVEMKSYTVPSGLLTFTMDNIFLGQLPVRIICVMTSNAGVNGTYKKNPYNFQHYNISFLNVTKDGSPINSRPIQPSFTATAPDFIHSYFSTFQGTGIGTKDDGYDVSREEYPEGYFANVYDLTVDGSASSHQWSLRKSGTIGLEARFSVALPEAINVIIYGEFQNLLEIDHERRVTTDY